MRRNRAYQLISLIVSFAFGVVATGYYLTWLADSVASFAGYFVAVSAPVAFCALASIVVISLFSGISKLAPPIVSAIGALVTIGWLIITMGANHA